MRIGRFTVGMVFAVALTLGQGAVAQCNSNSGSTGGNEVVGTLLGAAVGGLLGSQFGSGDGNAAMIGAGVLAGGLLGNRLGSRLDCEDQRYHGSTAQDALETQRTGTSSSWTNPDTGHSGSVTPTRTYQRADGTYCRDFNQSIVVDGRSEQATGTACRQDDGTWRVVG